MVMLALWVFRYLLAAAAVYKQSQSNDVDDESRSEVTGISGKTVTVTTDDQ